MTVKPYSDELFLLDLEQPMPGYKHFVSSWLIKSDGRNILVDPGPTSSIVQLISAFNKLSVKEIDLILLTHIHIDHAGGCGDLVKNFPVKKIICHPKGIPHLINPEKLWKGSLKVLGPVAEIFRKIEAVPENKLSYKLNLQINELPVKIIQTPGHAAHHLSYLFQDYLFCGEALGVNVELAGSSYIRLATPPVFKYEIFRNSILKLQQESAKYVCFAHHGLRDDLDNTCSEALTQLDLWLAITKKQLTKTVRPDIKSIVESVYEQDPSLADFNTLPRDIQEREWKYTKNSVQGIYDFILSQS